MSNVRCAVCDLLASNVVPGCHVWVCALVHALVVSGRVLHASLHAPTGCACVPTQFLFCAPVCGRSRELRECHVLWTVQLTAEQVEVHIGL